MVNLPNTYEQLNAAHCNGPDNVPVTRQQPTISCESHKNIEDERKEARHQGSQQKNPRSLTHKYKRNSHIYERQFTDTLN